MYLYPENSKLHSPMIFDTHAHYDDGKFSGLTETLMEDMLKNGVAGIITCGCDKHSSEAAVALSHKYDFVYSAVGIHPENLQNGTDLSFINELSKDNKCVAIGETGLDYYWESDNRALQLDVFEKQLILANELSLPIIVHDRDAHMDTLALLKKHRPKGVVHCFSGSAEMAKEILKLGMYIGIGGVVTFKNSKKLPNLIRDLPFDRILLETDAPYLAPEPVRGSICHSGLITYTAQKVADIKQIPLEEILKITNRNAKTLFNL